MSHILHPRQDILFRPVGEGGVLLDEAAQIVIALPPAPALVWCAAAEGQDPATVLADRAGIGRAEAAGHVRHCAATWARCGLLAGADRAAATTLAPAPRRPAPRRAVADGGVIRIWRMLGADLAVVFPDRAAAALAEPLFAHLAAAQGPAHDVVRVTRAPGGFQVASWLGQEHAAPEGLGPLLHARLTLRALDYAPGWAAVHGAALAWQDRVVLVPGRQGAGKSTLAAALVAAGWTLLGDDTVVAQDDPRVLLPLPVSICLKAGSWPVLAGTVPHLSSLPVLMRPDGIAARYLPPARPAAAAAPLAAVVAARWDAAGDGALRRVDASDALAELLPEVYPLSNRWRAEDLDRLVAMVAGVPCFRLAYAALDHALPALAAALAG